MKEDLLQHIWQSQYFNLSHYQTTSGELVQIINPASDNSNQGPDFKNSKIRIGETTWAGNVELHIRSSDWNLHKHSVDSNFDNIILNVVWQNDCDIEDRNEIILPALELQAGFLNYCCKNIDRSCLHHISFHAKKMFPVHDLILINWKLRLVTERLETKSARIFSMLKENNFHWEETFWWLIAENFDLKINSILFSKIVKNLPVSILTKHKNMIQQIEALLMGTAGLLDGQFSEKYPFMLQKEYRFLRKKYQLNNRREISIFKDAAGKFPNIKTGTTIDASS